MKISELMTKIESEYKIRFPFSHVNVRFYSGLGKSISIRCFIAGDRLENSGGYWDNDMVNVSFNISSNSGTFSKDITIDSECPANMTLESYRAYYHHKPINNPHNVYDSTRFTFRKVKGDDLKILSGFGKFCDGMKKELINATESGKIHPHYESIISQKIVK